jgi:adenosine deaminase
VRLAAKYRASSPCAVVGVDVAGGEEWIAKPPAPVGKGGDNDQEDESTSDLHTRCADALTEARKIGLNITLHAGEDTGAANVGAAIFDHGASRIGHGYALYSCTVQLVEQGFCLLVRTTTSLSHFRLGYTPGTT